MLRVHSVARMYVLRYERAVVDRDIVKLSVPGSVAKSCVAAVEPGMVDRATFAARICQYPVPV